MRAVEVLDFCLRKGKMLDGAQLWGENRMVWVGRDH